MRIHRLLLVVILLLGPALLTADHAVRVGTNVWPGYEPLYLAAEIAPEMMAGIQLVEYPSASEVIRGFRNQVLEAAALTLDEVLLLLESGLPLKVVLVMDVSQGGDVLLARPGIDSVAALRGHRIGVESSALGAYFLTRALEIHGLSVADITPVHLSVDDHEQAYRTGEVDAVATFEPVRTRLLNAGAQEVFSSAALPGEIIDVLVVHERVLRRDPARIRALLKGWFQAVALLRDRPEQAAGRMAPRLRLTPAEVLASYQGLHLPDLRENRQLLSLDLPVSTARLHTVLLREGLLREPVALQGLFEPALLPGH